MFKDTFEKIKKRAEEISGDIRESRDSVRGIFLDSRPTPVRNFIRSRAEKIKSRKRLGILEKFREEK